MLNRILALAFLVVFAWQSAQPLLLWGDYALRTSWYAQRCENKARPEILCNGKCQFIKQVKEDEQKREQNPTNKAENKSEFISTTALYSVPKKHILKTNIHFITHQIGVVIKMPRTIFHPPDSVV